MNTPTQPTTTDAAIAQAFREIRKLFCDDCADDFADAVEKRAAELSTETTATAHGDDLIDTVTAALITASTQHPHGETSGEAWRRLASVAVSLCTPPAGGFVVDALSVDDFDLEDESAEDYVRGWNDCLRKCGGAVMSTGTSDAIERACIEFHGDHGWRGMAEHNKAALRERMGRAMIAAAPAAPAGGFVVVPKDELAKFVADNMLGFAPKTYGHEKFRDDVRMAVLPMRDLYRNIAPTAQPSAKDGVRVSVPDIQRWTMAKGSDGAHWSVYMDHCDTGEWCKWSEVQQKWHLTSVAALQATTAAGLVDRLRELMVKWRTPDEGVPISAENIAAQRAYDACARQVEAAIGREESK